MQAGYIAARERRFSAMFDVLEACLPKKFTALDLGCGPGSLSVRLLQRFPQAQCVAVDYDPVLLSLGQRRYGTRGKRLHWVEADLRTSDWARGLGRAGRFDAVLSTTALHWLYPKVLRRVYQEAYRVLAPGGVLLNGDTASLEKAAPHLNAISGKALDLEQKAAQRRLRSDSWDAWWKAAGRVSDFQPLFEERRRRYGSESHHGHEPPADTHLRYLRAAGFSETAVLWREFNNALLVAYKE